MLDYCMMTHLQHYLFMALKSFACLVTWGLRARHVHNSIYLSFKYADPLAIMCLASAYL